MNGAKVVVSKVRFDNRPVVKLNEKFKATIRPDPNRPLYRICIIRVS
jgi:hypothetical protein